MKIKLSKKSTCNKTMMINRQKNMYTELDEKGFVLVVSLILLLVITLVGVLALSTSTTEVMIAGNQRIVEMNHVSADGGKSILRPIIEEFIYAEPADMTKFPIIKGKFEIDPSLQNELKQNDSDFDGIPNPPSPNHDDETDAHNNPDILIALPAHDPQNTVRIDIDNLYTAGNPGTAMMFGTGTKGHGRSMAKGGTYVVYKVNSFSKGNATGTGAEVGTLYRYLPK